MRLNVVRFPEILKLSPTDTDVLYLRVMGNDMVVLSSHEAISDLLEKRSSIYSDRVSGITILTTRS